MLIRRLISVVSIVYLASTGWSVGSAEETGSASDLELTMTVPESTVAMFEPVSVGYSVRNPTERAIEATVVMRYQVHRISFWITGPDGERIAYFRGPLVDTVLVEGKIAPGAIRFSDVDLLWNDGAKDWAFPIAGRYRLDAEMVVGSKRGSVRLRAQPVDIEVTEPAEEEARAIGFFPSKQDFFLLIRKGAAAYCRDRSGPGCLEELRRFLKEHSRSAYAPFITWDLASAVEGGRVEVKPKDDLAEELYGKYLMSWPDHPTAARVMYEYAFFLLHVGRDSKASEVADRLERRFPNRPDLVRTLRASIGETYEKRADPPK